MIIVDADILVDTLVTTYITLVPNRYIVFFFQFYGFHVKCQCPVFFIVLTVV